MMEKNEISRKHREEWQAFRQQVLLPAMEKQDAEYSKMVKTLAEALRLCQEGERRTLELHDMEIDKGLEISWQ